jgi:hypothetical protein
VIILILVDNTSKVVACKFYLAAIHNWSKLCTIEMKRYKESSIRLVYPLSYICVHILVGSLHLLA